MDNTSFNNRFAVKKQDVNIREIFDFLWRLRYWIIFSLFVTVAIAFVHLRMITPIYERTTWLMMNREDNKKTEMYLLPEFAGQTSSKKSDSELFSELYIIKSPTIVSKAVSELDINTRYYQYRKPFANSIDLGRKLLSIKKVELYNDSPFKLTIERDPLYPAEMQPGSIYIKFKDLNGTQFKISQFKVNGKDLASAKKMVFNYGDSISLGAFSLVLRQNEKPVNMVIDGKYVCTWNSPISIARNIVKNMNASVQGKGKNQSDIIAITIKDNVQHRAEDILNTLVRIINDESREYKNSAIQSTISFIDQRLSVISSELGDAETNYKNYQSSRVAIDLESQTQLVVKGDMDYQKQLTEVQLQLRILDMISSYLAEAEPGEYKVIPANVGVSDAGLNTIINNYNTLVVERNRMIANSSESNPRVLSAKQQLDDSKKAIELSIKNLLNMYSIRERELNRVIGNSQRKMAEIPQQQFELQQLSRRMEVIEPLFQLLQQKREEAQMLMYGSTDELRVIESAFGSNIPVFPDRRMILLIAIVLGFCIPPTIVGIRLSLNNKIQTKRDIEEIINTPVLSCLPKDKGTGYPLIPQNGHDNTSESFRMLRSNIQYMDGAKVIQVTSSIFGEGKSYVASNLALSMAHTGRKVILVGMDLRKPTLQKIFPGVRPKPKNNVVGFLTGKCIRLSFAIENSGVYDTLDVLMSGPIPPNPTEILSFNKQGELIEKLRETYDYVIIDSAPYLLASDSLLINTFVDATLYIIRADFTDKRLLGEINEAINSKHKSIKNPYIVLNGQDVASSKFRYGYGKEYGYGYNYGYNSVEE